MMYWLVGLLAIVLAIYFRKFRIALLVGVGIIGVIGLGLYLHGEWEEKESLNRISPREIAIEDLIMTPMSQTGDVYKLQGRIFNNSKNFRLDEIDFFTILLDCPKNKETSDCITIGSTTLNIYLSVPPGQARDFSTSATFPNAHPKGVWNWNMRISQIKAGEIR